MRLLASLPLGAPLAMSTLGAGARSLRAPATPSITGRPCTGSRTPGGVTGPTTAPAATTWRRHCPTPRSARTPASRRRWPLVDPRVRPGGRHGSGADQPGEHGHDHRHPLPHRPSSPGTNAASHGGWYALGRTPRRGPGFYRVAIGGRLSRQRDPRRGSDTGPEREDGFDTWVVGCRPGSRFSKPAGGRTREERGTNSLGSRPGRTAVRRRAGLGWWRDALAERAQDLLDPGREGLGVRRPVVRRGEGRLPQIAASVGHPVAQEAQVRVGPPHLPPDVVPGAGIRQSFDRSRHLSLSAPWRPNASTLAARASAQAIL
jgi:hypothetical protein